MNKDAFEQYIQGIIEAMAWHYMQTVPEGEKRFDQLTDSERHLARKIAGDSALMGIALAVSSPDWAKRMYDAAARDDADAFAEVITSLKEQLGVQ